MDALDDDAIIAELRGAAMKEYIYSFEQGDTKVTGLSKVGVDAAVAEMAKKGEVIREMEVDVHWLEDAVVVLVKAGRYLVSKEGKEILLETSFGSKRQTTKMTVYGKDQFGRRKREEINLVEDPFFFEKALSKAARNAKRRMIPEDLITMVIAEATKEGKIRRVDADGDAPPRNTRRRQRARSQQAAEAPKAEAPAEEAPVSEETPEVSDTREEEAPFEKPEDLEPAVPPTDEDAPPLQVDITRKELAEEARELGFSGGPAVFEALGVDSLDEWVADKASTSTPIKEALEKLKQGSESQEETPFDL